MTKLLEQALETIRKLAPAKQDEIAQAILDAAADDGEEDVDPADLPSLLEALADAEAGRFASSEEVEAAFRRFGK
jgi:predicted transcriptional regulator